MRAKDANLLLIRAFEHSPESRAEYFKIEAEKYGYSLGTFYNIMFEAYKRLYHFLERYQQTDNYLIRLTPPDTKERNFIWLAQFSDDKDCTGVITLEILAEMQKPLADFKLMAFSLPETTSTSEPQPIVPQPETPADKIRTILEPLRGAFYDPKHIDLIIEAMQTGVAPDGFHCENLQVDNKDFYPVFKTLHNETDLTLPLIAEILHRFIYSNNGSRNAIQPTAIIQNMKRMYN